MLKLSEMEKDPKRARKMKKFLEFKTPNERFLTARLLGKFLGRHLAGPPDGFLPKTPRMVEAKKDNKGQTEPTQTTPGKARRRDDESESSDGLEVIEEKSAPPANQTNQADEIDESGSGEDEDAPTGSEQKRRTKTVEKLSNYVRRIKIAFCII